MRKPSNSTSTPSRSARLKGIMRAVWPWLKTAAKGITGLAGLGAAFVAIVAWYPMAVDSLHPELKEYETLNSLYAGASVALFDGKLGPASIVMAVYGEPGMTERLYVKKDYVVETIATAEGQTKLFSVLSCSPNFKPSFEFRGSRITLQEKPLAELMPFGRPPEWLSYQVPQTVSSPTFFFEMTTEISGASGNRGSGYGVNGACNKDLPAVDYEGRPDAAPVEITDYRARVPANFYVESWDRTLREMDASNVNPFSQVTPYHGYLPPGWPRTSQ